MRNYTRMLVENPVRGNLHAGFGGAGRGNELMETSASRPGPTLFQPNSFGYRPGRRTQDAIEEIFHLGKHPSYYEWVIEGDVESCFDRLDRSVIMTELGRRIGDRRVLSVVRAFLKAGVMTEAGTLERRLTGTPQGGILSPLLMNVALDVLDREFEACRDRNYRKRRLRKGLANYRLIRYADDFVIMVRGTRAQAEAIMASLPEVLGRLGLTLSESKTRLTHIDDGFDFLGFHIVRKYRANKNPCIYTFVADEALASIKRKVKALTKRNRTSLSLQQMIRELNPILRGWALHFRFACAKRTFSYLGHYAWWRVARWLYKKHHRRGWKWLKRRYRLGGQPQEAGEVLYHPGKMPVIRYLYRGTKIATPWEEVEAEAPRLRQMSFDETESLGRLEESLVG